MFKTIIMTLLIFFGMVAYDSNKKADPPPAPPAQTQEAKAEERQASKTERGLIKALFLAVTPPMEKWPDPVRKIYLAINMEDVIDPIREQPDWTPLANTARDLPSALVAIEDHDFYNHGAIAAEGILRALLANITAGEVVQGGSTLTQQLVKNLFLTQEQSLERKISEAVLSMVLEGKYSKAEILELYLNTTYFGAGATGVKQAAAVYFDKAPSALTLAECAVIAALPYAPSALNPLKNAEGCKKRQNLVLNAMLKYNFINEKQLLEAKAEQIRLADGTCM